MRLSVHNSAFAAILTATFGILSLGILTWFIAPKQCVYLHWDQSLADYLTTQKSCPRKSSSQDSDSTISVHDGKLDVLEQGSVVWSSPADWQVEEAHVGDINGDGEKDIAALVAASREYGDVKPFWIKENDPAPRQHLYIFNIRNKKFHPVWMTSKIYTPTQTFLLADLHGDGHSQLITLDKQSVTQDVGRRTSDAISVWSWNSWGFTKVWGSATGVYWGLDILKSETGDVIIFR